MDNNDKNFSMIQLIMAAILFLCAVSGVLTHIFMGHIDTFGGYLFALIIIVLSWIFLRLSWKELKYSNSN